MAKKKKKAEVLISADSAVLRPQERTLASRVKEVLEKVETMEPISSERLAQLLYDARQDHSTGAPIYEVTPSMGLELLTLLHGAQQRETIIAHLEQLISDMLNQFWVTKTTSTIDINTSETYDYRNTLVGGKHRLLSSVISNVPFWTEIRVRNWANTASEISDLVRTSCRQRPWSGKKSSKLDGRTYDATLAYLNPLRRAKINQKSSTEYDLLITKHAPMIRAWMDEVGHAISEAGFNEGGKYSSVVKPAIAIGLRHLYDLRGQEAVDDYLAELKNHKDDSGGHPFVLMKDQFIKLAEHHGSRLYNAQFAVLQSFKRLDDYRTKGIKVITTGKGQRPASYNITDWSQWNNTIPEGICGTALALNVVAATTAAEKADVVVAMSS